MKLAAALVALAAANPADERAFADNTGFMTNYEEWWNPTHSANIFAKIEAGLPAIKQAFIDSEAPRRIKRNFNRDVDKLVTNLKAAKGRCDNKAAKQQGRKRRAPDERSYVFGDIHKDMNGLWWQFAKWTRNEFWYCEANVDAFQFYKRIDRYRWIYMRHFCNYVDDSADFCGWATTASNGQKFDKPFRQMTWFNNKFGKNAPNPLE